jgi:hypothetical protein
MAPPAGAAPPPPGTMPGQQPMGAPPAAGPGSAGAPPPEPMASPVPGRPAQAKPAEKPKVVAKKTEPAGKSSAGHMSATAAKVAECKRIGNLFERESCLWKACTKKWGTEGCPEYKRTEPTNGGG